MTLPTDNRKEIASFLRTRRERLDPRQFGFSLTRRRTPGLRREEVAMLAGVSVEWYRWLEQGRDVRASRNAIEQIGKALHLEPSEIGYLLVLSEHKPKSDDPHTVNECVCGQTVQLLKELNPSPAIVLGRRFDYLAWNDAATVFGDPGELEGLERNAVVQAFSPHAKRLFRDWDADTRQLVAAFRANYGKSIGCDWFEDVIDELKVREARFVELWGKHEVYPWQSGVKYYDHDQLGELAFEVTVFNFGDTLLSDTMLVTFVPVEGTETRAKLENFLKNRALIVDASALNNAA